MGRTMKTAALLLLSLLPALPARAAADADLQRCRALAEPGARLACYDALAVAPAAAAPAAPPTPPAPPVAAAAPPAVPARPEFGFEGRIPAGAPQAVESRLPGVFEGWGPGTRFRLENGQVWQVDDGSSGVAYLRDPKVKITRGLFGTFVLEIEGKNQAPRVRRLE